MKSAVLRPSHAAFSSPRNGAISTLFPGCRELLQRIPHIVVWEQKYYSASQ